MKKLLFILIALASLSYTNAQTVTKGIDLRDLFKPTPTYPVPDDPILKNTNFNTFFEVYKAGERSQESYVSIERTKMEGKEFLFKFIYDRSGNVSSVSVSSDNSEELGIAVKRAADAKALICPCMPRLYGPTIFVIDCFPIWIWDIIKKFLY